MSEAPELSRTCGCCKSAFVTEGCICCEAILLQDIADRLCDRATCFATKLRELGIDPEELYRLYDEENRRLDAFKEKVT